jgi:serine carboxypeptidase-like clade II
MLKYSGDTDGAVPLTGSMGWIDSLNLPIINPWRPYFFKNTTGNYLGGYIVDYNNMSLGTVHGAGHMAP